MSWRKGTVTHSKFRNVYGEPNRKDKSYENIRVSKNAWDGTYCTANPKFLAVVLDTSGAGGAFLVIPLEKVGHQKVDSPRVVGHQREILDIQWNPFNDHIIASGSEDTTIKIWRIPSGGLTEDLLDPLVDLRAHQRKVGIVRWHPTANGIIASAGFDFRVIVWNALKAKALCTVDGHRDTIYDLAFNYNGSLIATTSRDKKIRVINAHTGKVLQSFAGHGNPKASHVAFTDKHGDRLVTTGFSLSGERQICVWDLSKPSSPLKADPIDNSSGILMLHYDIDIHVAYAAGKGDGIIRYYEIKREDPFLLRLSEYRNATPQKSLGKMCKRGLDTSRCEVYRFYKLHPNNWIEPLSMICPRRSDEFQEDIYPPTPSMHPALTADEWMNGADKEPNLISFKDGSVSHHAGPTSPTSPSSADKYNSMFNKPAKFERQPSRDAVLSNDVNHNTQGTSQSSHISKTTVQEVHAVNDEELNRLKQLCKDQAQEIEALKRTISIRDQRIFKLEQELASKNGELSDMSEQFSQQVAELKKANNRLASRLQNAVSAVDGRPGGGDVALTKTSLTTVESMPELRPARKIVDEPITSSIRSQKSFDDYDIHQVLEDAHSGPVHTRAPRQEEVARSPETDYRLEDIEAELESLREDLAKTREVRHGKKTKVKYVSEDQSSSGPGDGYSRTVYTGSVSTTGARSPTQSSYTGFSSHSPPKYGSHGYGSSEVEPHSQKSDVDGKKMIITTASYSRVPKHETSETTFGRQSTSPTKDRKSYL